MTKDRALDRDLDVLVRTHLSTPTDASTFISVLGPGAVGRPQLERWTPLHHDTARCPTRDDDLPKTHCSIVFEGNHNVSHFRMHI